MKRKYPKNRRSPVTSAQIVSDQEASVLMWKWLYRKLRG